MPKTQNERPVYLAKITLRSRNTFFLYCIYTFSLCIVYMHVSYVEYYEKIWKVKILQLYIAFTTSVILYFVVFILGKKIMLTRQPFP